MANVKFVLNRRKLSEKNEPQYLEIYVYYDGKKVYKSIGIKLYTDEWDRKLQQVVKRGDSHVLNKHLLSLKVMLESEPSLINEISTNLQELYGLGTKKYSFFNNYYEDLMNNDFRIATSTYIDQKGTLKLLNEFGMVGFEFINLQFIQNFEAFLIKKNYGRNTIAKHHKWVHKFINKAVEEGLIQHDPYDRYTVDVLDRPYAIYLSVEELSAIEKIDGLSPDFERIRDLFLVSCYTALRYSDMIRLTKDHIYYEGGKAYISMVTQKTHERVVIPVHPVVQRILDRHNGFPIVPKKTNQQFNTAIKHIAKEAGVTELVDYTLIKGRERIDESKPKWRLVTMHTGRRSGATNMFLAGISPIMIMKITGHTTERSFMQYIRIDSKQNAQLLSENPFFK